MMKKVLYAGIFVFSLSFLLLAVSCGGAGGGGGSSAIPSTTDMGILQGRLLDHDNWPLKDATLKLTPGDYSDSTDDTGYYAINAPVNRYRLSINYDGRTFDFKDEIDLKKDSPLTLELSLNPVSGYIISHPLVGLAYIRDISSIDLSALGYIPVAGATVSLTGIPFPLTTDSNGYFQYDLVLTGIQTLDASHDNKSISENVVVTSKTDITDLATSSVLPENVTMLVGSVRQFTAYGVNTRNELVLPEGVDWSVKDIIGTINNEGIFIAQNVGVTEVYGKFGGHTVKANVIVTTGTGNISGRVSDGITGQPVSDVIVNVAGVSIFDVTDVNGEFFLGNIPANLNVLLSVTDEGTLIASKTVFVIPDTTVNTEIVINPPGPVPTATPSGTGGHPFNNSVLTTIQTGKSPKGIALSPDGTKGYVATELGTFVFSTETNQIIDSVQIGVTPANKKIAISPDGSTVYVTNNGADTVKVAFVRTSDNSIVYELETPQSPFDIAISSDGSKLYVANEDQSVNYIYVINTSTRSVTDTIEVDKIPHGLDISPDGTRLYSTSIVTDYTPQDRVSVINTSTNSVINTISVGGVPSEIALTPDGKKAYVANSGSNTISVINTQSASVSNTIALSGAPLSVKVSPDGTRVFVTHFDDYVTVIDTAGDTVFTTIDLSATVGEDVVFSPDGLRAYVVTSGGGGIIHVIY